MEDKYDMLEKVGEGTYGVVYKAKKKGSHDGRLYALKVTKSSMNGSDGLPMSSCREIALLQDLDHINIVRVQEMFFSAAKQEVRFVFDYAEYDLWAILNHHRMQMKTSYSNTYTPPTESMQKSVTHQILLGIEYLHSNWVLHRDLKPANILIMGLGAEAGRVKIADLGMARLFLSPLKPLQDVDPVVVTYWYRAPELLLGAKHYTKAIDLWAIGCIMAEMMLPKPLFWIQPVDSSKEPYFKEQLHAIFSHLGKPAPRAGSMALEWPLMEMLPSYHRFVTDFQHQSYEGASLEKQFSKCPPTKLQLLSGMLRFDPAQRFSAQQALASPWFREDPVTQHNVFNSLPAMYPVRTQERERTDASKDKKAKDSSHQRQPAAATQRTASHAAKRPRLAHDK